MSFGVIEVTQIPKSGSPQVDGLSGCTLTCILHYYYLTERDNSFEVVADMYMS